MEKIPEAFLEHDQLLLEYDRLQSVLDLVNSRVSLGSNATPSFNRDIRSNINKQLRGGLIHTGIWKIEKKHQEYVQKLIQKINSLHDDQSSQIQLISQGQTITLSKLEDEINTYAKEILKHTAQTGSIGKYLADKEVDWQELKDTIEHVLKNIRSLIALLENIGYIRPSLPIIKIKSTQKQYWHAGITGRHGEVIDSIQKQGLLPKDQLTAKTGNIWTQSTGEAYVTTDPKAALRYLIMGWKSYDHTRGGLPFVLSIKINEFTKQYSFDSEMIRQTPSSTFVLWYALIQGCIDINGNLQELYHISTIRTEPWINALTYPPLLHAASNAHNLLTFLTTMSFTSSCPQPLSSLDTFLNNTQLSEVKEKISSKVWERFLIRLNEVRPGKSLSQLTTQYTKNLAKTDGWDPSFIDKIYIITPNGEKDWRKWASIIPEDQIIVWEKWSELKYDGKNKYPGNGKFVAIKETK